MEFSWKLWILRLARDEASVFWEEPCRTIRKRRQHRRTILTCLYIVRQTGHSPIASDYITFMFHKYTVFGSKKQRWKQHHIEGAEEWLKIPGGSDWVAVDKRRGGHIFVEMFGCFSPRLIRTKMVELLRLLSVEGQGRELILSSQRIIGPLNPVGYFEDLKTTPLLYRFNPLHWRVPADS